jgi:hypothetical protein
METIVKLFFYLSSKDVIIKSYTRYLASRLLNKRYNSLEAEEHILHKVRNEFGYDAIT